MVEVEITNFGKISHAKLMIEGFTALVGRNTRGKSTILRAIVAALTNRQGTKFIRWGQTFCEVRIKTKDLNLLWHKEEGKNYYEINGETYHKVGKEVPPDPIIKAGFGLTTIGDEKINLQYAKQFSPLFLMDRQDSKGADLIATVYGLDRLYKAIELCNKEQKSTKDTLKIRQKDLIIADEDLKKFSDFDKAKQSIESLKSHKKIIDTQEAHIAKLTSWQQQLIPLFSEYTKLKNMLTVELPEEDPLQKSCESYARLCASYRDLVSYTAQVQSLSVVEEVEIPTEPDTHVVQAALTKLSGYQAQIATLATSVRSLKIVENVGVEEPKVDFDTLLHLKSTQEKILEDTKACKTFEQELSDIDTELKNVEKDLGSFDRCPACGAELKEEHVC